MTRILIIDDEQYRHDWFTPRLKEIVGVEVHNATNGEQALLLLRNNEYDLVFFDHDLGDCDRDWHDYMTDPADKRDYSEIVREVEAEVERLRILGWTQADFARALKGLLVPEVPVSQQIEE